MQKINASDKIFLGVFVLCALLMARVVQDKFRPEPVPAPTPAETAPRVTDTAKVRQSLEAAGLPLHDASYWKKVAP